MREVRSFELLLAVENNKEATEAKGKPTKRERVIGLSEILNGEFLTREVVTNNLGFILFIIALLVGVVGKGYYGKQLSKDIDTAQKALDEMTAEYVESKAKLEENTKRQVLVEKLEAQGLKETVNPTKVIRLKKEDEGK